MQNSKRPEHIRRFVGLCTLLGKQILTDIEAVRGG
jgi:hypothetical protein